MKTINDWMPEYARSAAVIAAVLVVLMIALVIFWPGSDKDAGERGQAQEREILYWVAPMDSSYRRDEPGKSPMGMDLVPVYADEAEEPGVVRVAPEVQARLGVRLGEVTRGDLSRDIDAFGRIDYDEARRSHVHLRTSGWIEKLHVRTTGALVEQGQPLFDLYSPELISAQEEFVQVLRAGVPSRVRGVRERLIALGVPQEHIDTLERTREVQQTVTIRAHHGGGVVEALNVAEGMRVTPGDMPLELVDLSGVWVLADIHESQAAWVAAGQPAQVRLPFRPGEEYETSVDYVYPELDRKTRTVRARLLLTNNGNGSRLQPGMYASVRIQAPARESVLSVPREALIRTGRQERVVTVMDDGNFRVVAVRSGMESGDRVEILQGLEEGQKVVVSGQFLIDSEASVSAEAGRLGTAEEAAHDHDHSEAPAVIEARGEIRRIDVDAGVINLDHEPIPELGWPRMVMDFQVADGVDLSALTAGDEVRFRMRERGEMVYEITAIESVPEQDDHEHDHDDTEAAPEPDHDGGHHDHHNH